MDLKYWLTKNIYRVTVDLIGVVDTVTGAVTAEELGYAFTILTSERRVGVTHN